MLPWLLGFLTLLGIAALVYALFGLRRARTPRAASRFRWLAAASVFLLAAGAYFGWPGPFGAPGPPLGAGPDVPRSSLQTDVVLQVARQAAGPSNRDATPRVEAARQPAQGEAESVVLLLRANDAPDAETMRRQIRSDAWAILRRLFEDPRLARLLEVSLLVTHPTGRDQDGGEPIVAVVTLTRERFERLNAPGVSPDHLDDVADIQWHAPLDG